MARPTGWWPDGGKVATWASGRAGWIGSRESQADINGDVEVAEWTERTAVESRLEEARTRVIGLTSRTATTTSDGVARRGRPREGRNGERARREEDEEARHWT